MKIKIQNIKNPVIIMEVTKDSAGLYLGTKEWKLYKKEVREEFKKDFKYEK